MSNVKILAFGTLYASAHLTNRTKQPHKVEILFSSLGIFRFFLVFRIKLNQSLIDGTPSSWILIGHSLTTQFKPPDIR